MKKATKVPVYDIARCPFCCHCHRVNECTGTKNKVGPFLLDIFKPYGLFSSTPISLPLISLPLISLYLIVSCLAGGAEARTAGAGRSAASPPLPLREQAGATAVVVEREGRTAAGAGRRRRGGARGPHGCRSSRLQEPAPHIDRSGETHRPLG